MAPRLLPARGRSIRSKFFGHRLVTLVAAGAGLLLAYAAHAVCAGPEIEILWSYPADGDTAVPTNVDLWMLPSVLAPITVTLNGQIVETPDPQQFLYDLGELAPRTRYTVGIEIQGYMESTHDELSFTTGDGPGEPDPGAAPGKVSSSRHARHNLGEYCETALFWGVCLDGGQNTNENYAYAPSGTAKAWLIQESPSPFYSIWPAECGAPRVLAYGGDCVTLSGIDAVGAVHPGKEICADDGCSLSVPSGSRAALGAGLSLLACLGLRRRPRQLTPGA
jgi:hypothetical protein